MYARHWSNYHRDQWRVYDWVRRVFGVPALARRERALRVMEEALELAQASDLSMTDIGLIAEYVYAKPRGSLPREIAGTCVSLMAMAETEGLRLDELATAELDRVNAMDAAYFRKRYQPKHDAGIGAPLVFPDDSEDDETCPF